MYDSLSCILRRRSTCNNFDKFSSNDSLPSSIEENLKLVDHVAGIL